MEDGPGVARGLRQMAAHAIAVERLYRVEHGQGITMQPAASYFAHRGPATVAPRPAHGEPLTYIDYLPGCRGYRIGPVAVQRDARVEAVPCGTLGSALLQVADPMIL